MITSSRNPKIQLVRDLLAHSKARREQGAFIVEGVRLTEEAAHAGWAIRLILWSDDLSERGQSLVDSLTDRGIPVEQLAPIVFRAVSDTQTPQGLLAIVEFCQQHLPSDPNFLLLIDNLHDPGNIGTILRTAGAAGVQAVLLSPGCADPYAPKVVRSAMGAHFRLPILALSWPDLRNALQHLQPNIFLADAVGDMVYTQADFRLPLTLVIGSEADGIGPQARALVGQRVTIPMPGHAESLNAAVAAAILMFEVVRQRTVP